MGTKKTSAAWKNGSKRESEQRIVMNDQSGRYAPNVACCAMLAEALPLWMPAHLFFKVTDALRGYSKGMATVMTECVIGFVSGTGRRLTGIGHVDDQLLTLYRDIHDYALLNGHKLEIVF